jgi:hypothetical protein
MLHFRPNDIVECIDETPVRAESRVMPSVGRLYTVAGMNRVGDGYSVRLKELAPTCYLGGPCGCGECGWDAGRFRKVYRPKNATLRAMVCTETVPA